MVVVAAALKFLHRRSRGSGAKDDFPSSAAAHIQKPSETIPSI